MDGHRVRAVLAGLPDGDAAAASALAEAGCDVIGRAAGGASALALVRDTEPDLVLADAVLPGMDGVEFVRRARRLKLNLHPAILLMRLPGLLLPGEDQLAALGAAAIGKPPTAEAILGAFAQLDARPMPLPADKAARLAGLLDALGVPEHPGRTCLMHAVALAWGDRRRLRAMKDGLYPTAGRLSGMAPAQAERAIRYVIDAAWRTGSMEQQQKIFGDTIDARRGRPTCGEMIAQLADILRWEG